MFTPETTPGSTVTPPDALTLADHAIGPDGTLCGIGSLLRSMVRPARPRPAEFTRARSGPISEAASTAAWPSSSLDTSHRTNMPPISVATCWPRSSWRSAITTLPPFSAAKGTNPKRTWNFVDGGYSDASGATTALDLYNGLQLAKKEKGLKAKMYVILLTSTDPTEDFDKVDGALFRDTLAPIDAILKVRSLLSTQAVRRAANQLNKVHFASKLDQEAFDLPLGWKLSRATHRIVSMLAGRPDLFAGRCSAHHMRDQSPQTSADGTERRSADFEGISQNVLEANSCIMRSIVATATRIESELRLVPAPAFLMLCEALDLGSQSVGIAAAGGGDTTIGFSGAATSASGSADRMRERSSVTGGSLAQPMTCFARMFTSA